MNDLPVDVLHWLVALSPIVLLLVLLTVLKWKAPQAGPVGVFLGALTAVIFFRTPIDALAAAVGAGVWDAVFILFVVWPALLLYRASDSAGAFAALRRGIQRFSRNELFLVLGFGWVFASFLQGIAGFGTPIAVVAPLLLALGVKPVLAVVIPLIGHAWANMFGTLAVGWLATLQVVDLENEQATAVQAAILLWIPNIAAGFTIAWLFGRWSAVKHSIPFVLIISLIQGGGQVGVMFFSPILSTFIPATLALVALYPLSRWSRYSERAEQIEDRPAMADRSDRDEDDEPEPAMSFAWSLVPYIALTISAVAVLAIPPVSAALETVEVGLPFGDTSTGYGVENEPGDPYSPFTPLTHPGVFLLFATLVAWIAYRAKGFYRTWAERSGEQKILASTASDAIPSSIAIVSFLVLAKILDYSGQVEVLALGIAAVAPAVVYAFLANFVGVIGAFMTSSNTASNVLFSQLQETVAETEGLSESAIIAAQSTGGAVGNSIAPANVVLGTTTAGIVGQEGAVLRKTLPWAAAVSVAVGAVTILLA
ncbi:L-lactate permease [Cellulomonas sp. ATA003]|uniref:L-lactate permease n=1 Tax=Cellulomonas sp. ATA003 TaxID=3073064 RepID=UPI0028730A75|nr:L-lactate permease [Cellulomonas sp. ATA003]WNB85416.1 L-lactate permease [Cellulomonas sp. ATA003]